MNQNSNEPQDRNELRSRAEKVFETQGLMKGMPASIEGMSPDEVQSLIHELQVHQIELEMQNDELHQMHEKLAVAHDRYFDLFELAPVGYFIINEDGIIQDANLAGGAIVGVESNKLQGKAFTNFIHEQDQDNFYLCRLRATQTHERVDCEMSLSRGDGRLVYACLEFAQVAGPASSAGQLRVIAMDITQRVLSEQSLAKDRIILSGAERLAQLGGWEWDIERNEVSLSTELQHIYGCKKSYYTMDEFLRLTHPEDQSNKRTILMQALTQDAPIHFEHRIVRESDQIVRNIQTSGEAVFDEEGKALKFYGAAQDVTDLKKNERKLQAYTAELEILNRDLESFAYMASHDLQAPLRKIQQFGEMVKNQVSQQLDPDTYEGIERIQRIANNMQALVSSLLKYSRAAKGILVIEPVDLSKTVLEVLDNLDSQIKENEASIEVGELPVISAEPTLMHQLFQNLIENALKFHRSGESPVVKVTAKALSTEKVEIRVSDEGIGFDEIYLNRIFRPFDRLHGISEYEGNGIGLATCRKIVERHLGTISAQAKPNQGATFIITLPVTQPAL